jgi:hypothetical protein
LRRVTSAILIGVVDLAKRIEDLAGAFSGIVKEVSELQSCDDLSCKWSIDRIVKGCSVDRPEVVVVLRWSVRRLAFGDG